jgi:hypothetical protein
VDVALGQQLGSRADRRHDDQIAARVHLLARAHRLRHQARRRRGGRGARGGLGDFRRARRRLLRHRRRGGFGIHRQACVAQHTQTDCRRFGRQRIATAAHRHRHEAEAGDQRAKAQQVERRRVREVGQVNQQRRPVEQRRRLRHPRRETGLDFGQIGTERLQDGQRNQAALEPKRRARGHAGRSCWRTPRVGGAVTLAEGGVGA